MSLTLSLRVLKTVVLQQQMRPTLSMTPLTFRTQFPDPVVKSAALTLNLPLFLGSNGESRITDLSDPPIRDNHCPGSLTELELYLLAEGMDPSDFRKVGLALGFTEAKLSQFEKDKLGNSMLATYQMLSEWRKTVRESEARETLVDTLESIKLVQLADSVRTGQVGDDIPSMTEAEIKRVAEDVKRYLAIDLCQIQADPLNSELLLKFERIFTNLTLMEEDKGTKHKTPLLYGDLLRTEVSGIYPKRLLVEGEGGVGKTTLCAKIAWDWIHGKGYQDFKLVLVVLLREAKDKTVGEIVKSYLPKDNPVTAKKLNKYVLSNPKDVFLVLDGLDEFAVDLNSIQQIALITLNRLFESGTVLITSRQWRSDEIRKNAKLRKVFAFIAVEDFSAENLSSYITKFFHPDTPYPIYTAMLCIMWKEFDGEHREAMSKLQTFSQLFNEMIDFLVDHYLSKHIPSSGIVEGELRENRSDIRHHLLQMGHIAFKGLLERRLVFTEEAFQSYPESIDVGCKVGVLTREKKVLPRRDRRTNPNSAVPSVQFPHKLFQEYLSGMHLASLHNSNRNEYDGLVAKIITEAREYRYLLYFISAQQTEIGLDIVSHLTAGKRERRHDDDDFVVDVAYESQDQTVAKAVADHLSSESSKTLKITEEMQAHTVSGHIFIMNHREVDHLTIQKPCGRTASEDLAELMCSSRTLRSVTIATSTTMHDVFYSVLANKAADSKIETLDIRSDDLSDRPDASRNLAQFICKLPYLKNLTFCGYYHDDFYSTSSAMASSTKIETLDIRSDDLSERLHASSDLAQFICKMPHLKNLTLAGYYHDAFYSTSSAMAPSAKIETLDIRSDDLSERPHASSDLAQFIRKMPHLKNLTLAGYYHDAFYSTSSAMAPSAKIETLHIISRDLSDRPNASRDLAQFICKMPHLNELTLGGYYHDDFYSTSSAMASSAKIETLRLFLRLSERPSASRDCAQFICNMPHLKDLTLNGQYNNDFYSTSSSMAASAKRGNTSPTLTELTVDDRTLEGCQDCGSMFDNVKRVTMQIRSTFNCDVIQRIHLPGATELTIETHEYAGRPAGFNEELNSLPNVLLNISPQLVKVTFSDLDIGNSKMELILQAFKPPHNLKHLKTIRFVRCGTDSVKDVTIACNEDQVMAVEVEHGKPRGKQIRD
eukprot:XP_011672616.1 PREDICTED: uncharacterized protein LOC105442325 [Strongylocentrotus purpuratus]